MDETVRFNFDTACELTNKLTTCMDVLESENDRLQNNFSALNEHFKDAYYEEFKVEFEKGDRIIKAINEDVRDLTVALINYAMKMGELEHGGK